MNRPPEPTFQEKHENLMNHVILPRYLPQMKSLEEHDLQLMSLMVENVNDKTFSGFIPPNTLKMIRGVAHVHRTLNQEIVSNEIGQLKPGETFAMFVRRQNCAVMIHMPTDINQNQSDHVIIATFPGNFHPKYLHACESDVEVKI